MDFSMMSQSGMFTNSTFVGGSSVGPDASIKGTPDKNNEKRFYDWHQKQRIAPPQDYPVFASQPAPFSSIPQNPNAPTAASPYLRKVMMHQHINTSNGSDSDDMFGADIPERRKPTLKKSTSSTSPTTGGQWPKSMFGSRPPTRTRHRTSSTPDINLGHDASESNLPPLASIYDDMGFDTAPSDPKPHESCMSPTQVRVANFSEERFSDLIRTLRRYYGPILEPYSGLPDSENKYTDPEIIPREHLDLATAKLVQPLSGSDGGPGPWVRITFRNRDCAEKAISGATQGQLVVGGRRIAITSWDTDPIQERGSDLPFQMMDLDATPLPPPRRNVLVPQQQPAADPGSNGQYSKHMPGARLVEPKPIAFEKQEGWFSSVTSSIIGSGNTAKAANVPANGAQSTWGQTLYGGYNWVMNDIIGMKHL